MVSNENWEFWVVFVAVVVIVGGSDNICLSILYVYAHIWT